MVKLNKNGQEFEYRSLADACHQNGSTTAKNRNACIRYLEKAGFDMSDFEQTDYNTGSKPRKASLGIVERVMKMCATIDKDKIAELQKKVSAKIASITQKSTGKDVDEIVAINQEIAKLQNPEVTDEALIAKFTEMVAEYHAAAAEVLENLPNEDETPEQPNEKK